MAGHESEQRVQHHAIRQDDRFGEWQHQWLQSDHPRWYKEHPRTGSYERLMQLARGCYRPATTQVDEKKRQSERAKAKAGYAAQPRPTCEKSPGVGNLQSLCNRQSAKDAVQSQRLRKPQYESRSSTEERTGIQRQRSARLSYRDLDIVIAPCTNSHLNGSG